MENSKRGGVVDTTMREIEAYKGDKVNLSDRATFNQYTTVNQIKTHQNNEFLTSPATGQKDTRDFYDVVTPAVQTAVANIDVDTSSIEPYAINDRDQRQALLSRSLLNGYFLQVTEGARLNEMAETFMDDGNIVLRKLTNEEDSGMIYEEVNLLNLYVIDQTAKTLEDTTVIEKAIFSISELDKMSGAWENIDKVKELGNMAGEDETPYYRVYYRYGELSVYDFLKAKNEVYGEDNELLDEDKEEYIQTLSVVVEVRQEEDKKFEKDDSDDITGVAVFVEELKPKIKKIGRKKIKKYKPYIEGHLGKYNGTWLRKGYRQMGTVYQNRANEIGNQIKAALDIGSKLVFWSPDEKIAGKNILSSIKNGQILRTDQLNLLNNQFPNLAAFVQEWNRTVTELNRTLKAFEAATGEQLPSSTSATAVAVQNQQVGKYYSYIREKYGLFLSDLYQDWVIPTLIKYTDLEDKIEIMGDNKYLQEYAEMLANKQLIQMEVMAASQGGFLPNEAKDMVMQQITNEIVSNKKNFLKIEKDFFKESDIGVAVNITGENFNKQARVTNGISMMPILGNPQVMNNQVTRDMAIQIMNDLGFYTQASDFPPIQAQQAMQPQQQGGRLPQGNQLPQTEQSLQEQALGEAPQTL